MTQLISELPTPYRELAQMRRAQQGGWWDKLTEAFSWSKTPEGRDFWDTIHAGHHPPITDASLRDLEEWLIANGCFVEFQRNGSTLRLGLNPKPAEGGLKELDKLKEAEAQQATGLGGTTLDPARFERLGSGPTNPVPYQRQDIINIIQYTLSPEQFKGYLLGSAMRLRLEAKNGWDITKAEE